MNQLKINAIEASLANRLSDLVDGDLKLINGGSYGLSDSVPGSFDLTFYSGIY